MYANHPNPLKHILHFLYFGCIWDWTHIFAMLIHEEILSPFFDSHCSLLGLCRNIETLSLIATNLLSLFLYYFSYLIHFYLGRFWSGFSCIALFAIIGFSFLFNFDSLFLYFLVLFHHLLRSYYWKMNFKNHEFLRLVYNI